MEGRRNPFVLFIFLLCIDIETSHIHWAVLFVGRRLRPAAARGASFFNEGINALPLKR